MNSDGQHKTGMTRKRSKSNASALHYLSTNYDARRAEAGKEHDSSLDSLPRETLLLIFANLQFPSRQCASIVCRRWRDLLLEPPFCRFVAPGQSLSEALQASSSGDTLICPPGMYQETLLVDKPMRLVSKHHWRRMGREWAALSAMGTTGGTTELRSWRRCARVSAQSCGGVATHEAAAAVAADPEPGSGAGPSVPYSVERPAAGKEPHQLQKQLRQRSGGSSTVPRDSAAEGSRSRSGAAYGEAVGAGVPSVSVLSLRPPVVVMDARCCFVGFEFHTSVAHNDFSISCFGPSCQLARFEYCTFSGLTGLRVPYSKGVQTRLELYNCSLIGTTEPLAAVQMDAGQLRLVRCLIQNNSGGVEVGPEALARLEQCELRWCGTALVVDGCLALENCRLWGNGKVGNLATETRLRDAQIHSEACLASGGPMAQLPARKQQRPDGTHPLTLAPPSPACLPRVAAASTAAASAAEALAPSGSEGAATAPPSGVGAEAPSFAGQRTIYGRRRGIRRVGDEAKAVVRASSTPGGGAGTSTAPSGSRPFQQQVLLPGVARCGGAGRSGTGGSGGASPSRVVALAKMQWTEVADAFSCHQQLVRVVGCEVAAPQLIVRTGLHKEVRKKARELVRQVYGEPDNDPFHEWEVLGHSDLDSDYDEEDSSVSSGGVGTDDEDLDVDLGYHEDPLNAADDPDLDESGGSQTSASDTEDSDAVSGSGGRAQGVDIGGGVVGGEGSEVEEEGEDEEWAAEGPMSSGEESTDDNSSGSSASDGSSSTDSSSSSGSDVS